MVPADIIDLGEQALVGMDIIKNKNVIPAKDLDQAMIALANKLNISSAELENRLANSPKTRIQLENMMKTGNYLQISLPISAAVTAYARMNIYQYKDYVVKQGGILYYSDTDSIFTSIPLPDNMISGELGKMKLEYVADRAVFLAPKVYAVNLLPDYQVEIDGKLVTQIIKIKGAKKNHGLSLNDLENLLFKDVNHKIKIEKWFRSFEKGTINIRDLTYSLKVTANKRALIYTNNKFAYTKPFVLSDGGVKNS